MIGLIQAATQNAQQLGTPGGPAGPPKAFSYREALFQLVQFVGYFLAIGALGFRYGIVRRMPGASDEAKRILRADNAALLGIIGLVLLFVSYLGGPYVNSVVEHKTFAEALPKNIAPLQLKMALLLLALIGFSIVRASSGIGWTLAAIGILIAVLQPLYTARSLSGRVNAVHILAASTWLGTLLVLTLIGIRGVIRTAPPGLSRAELVCDLVNSFSPLALSAASIVALTGATTAWLHLKRFSALWTTGYGIALIVKLVFVGMVVIMGAWNWKRVRPSLGESGSEETIRRSSTMELTFGALVLIATSVLVSLPSPR
ncbi:MAG TPA: CopD family protein [Gemmatimonadaceae bacterium]|nr:CopD family protein [Gemmatimonadaceae bacterium]